MDWSVFNHLYVVLENFLAFLHIVLAIVFLFPPSSFFGCCWSLAEEAAYGVNNKFFF